MSVEDGEKKTGWPDSLSPRQQAFLERFAEVGNVLQASQNVCHRCSHYEWIEVYKARFEVARAMHADKLVIEAKRLALEGDEIPVVRNGKVVKLEDGTVLTRKSRSVSLLRFLIKHDQDPAQRPTPTARQPRTRQNPTFSTPQVLNFNSAKGGD